MRLTIRRQRSGIEGYPWTVILQDRQSFYTNVRTFEDACVVVANYLDNGWFLGYPL